MFFKIVEAIGPNKEKVYIPQQLPFDKYELPEKIYGNMAMNAKYVWNTFAKPNGRASVLCTGLPGFGKSQMCKLLCNLASENGIPIYILAEIDISNQLISYISTLNNCVIFIDEFGKQLGYRNQNQFLSLLSDNNKKRLFLLTENDEDRVSSYILNRPERIRYHFVFDTLDPLVIKEFCSDYNVPEEFMKQLLTLNATNKLFSFDHLQTLVQEAIRSNCWDIDWLTSVLNIKTLQTKEFYYPVSVSDLEKKYSFPLDQTIVTKGIQKIELKRKHGELTPEDEEFIKTIEAAYIDVDTGQANRGLEGEIFRMKSRGGTILIKVNINPDFLLTTDGTEEVYPDVTGKFLVTVKHGKLKL